MHRNNPNKQSKYIEAERRLRTRRFIFDDFLLYAAIVGSLRRSLSLALETAIVCAEIDEKKIVFSLVIGENSRNNARRHSASELSEFHRPDQLIWRHNFNRPIASVRKEASRPSRVRSASVPEPAIRFAVCVTRIFHVIKRFRSGTFAERSSASDKASQLLALLTKA